MPITVFCAAPARRAHVERGRRPPAPLSVELEVLANGGSMVIPEQTGHLPGLTGRLNPILDNLYRCTCTLQTSPLTKAGSSRCLLRWAETMRLTDVHDAEWLVRFVEMIGNSSVLEYEPPPARAP